MLWAAVGVAAALLLWQAATSLQLLGTQFGPAFSPDRTGRALVRLAMGGELWPHLGASMRRVLVGLALVGFKAQRQLPVGRQDLPPGRLRVLCRDRPGLLRC